MSDVYERIQTALNSSKENKKKKQSSDNDVYSRIDSAFESVRQQNIKNGTYISPTKKANEWIQTVNSFRKDVGSIKSDSYNSPETLTGYNSRITELDKQRNELITQLNKNKRLYGAEDTERAIEALSAINFDDVNSALNSYSDYFSQWENEDAFNYAKAQNDKKQTYANMTDEELEQEIEKNKQGNQWYDKAINKLSKIGSYIPTTDANTPISTINKVQQAQQTTRGAVEQSETESLEKDSNIALLQKEKNNRVLKEFETLPTDVKNLVKGYVKADRETDEASIGNIGVSLAKAVTGQQGGSNAYNTQNATVKSEAEEYARLLNEKGVDWTKYVEPLRIASDEGYYANTRRENKEFAKENPFTASVASVLSAPVKMLGAVEMLESATDKDSNQLNYNSPYFVGNKYQSDVRETVMQNYDWQVNEGGKDWFDEIYGIAMSSGDTLINTAIGGGVPGVAASMLGVEAATDTAMQTAENGGSKWDALVTGTIAGVNEALFEKISIGNLKGMASKSISNYFSKDGVKTLFLNLAKSGLINASEEACTEAANIVTDYLVNGGTSSFVETYNAGLAQGLSEAEAKKQAYTAMSKQIGEAGVSGALQGLLFGGLGSATAAGSQRAEERSVGKQYNNTEYMALREQAENLGINVDKYRYGNNVKVGRLETLVQHGEFDQHKQELVKNAESYGIDVSKYLSGKNKTLSDENFLSLQETYNERKEEIAKEVNEKADLIWRNAFKQQLEMMGESPDKASVLAGKIVRVINKDTSNGVVLNKNAETLIEEYKSGNLKWVELANEKIVEARVETENKYITRLEDKKSVEAELKAVKEAQAKVESSEPSVEDVIKDEKATLNATKEVVFDKTKNLAVMESAGRNYVKYFNEIFNAGLKGKGTFEGFDRLATHMHYDTTESWRREVYNAGLQTRYYTPGVHRHDYYGEELSKVQKAQLDILDSVGKRYDIAIITVNEREDLNGWYKEGSNRIIVSLDAEGDLLLKTAGHELYHYIEEWNAEGAQWLKEVVLNNLSKTEKWNYEAEVARYAKLYGMDKVADREKIDAEIVADSMFTALSDKDFVESLVKNDKTLSEKIRDFLKDFLKEIKNMLGNFHDSVQLEALREYKVLIEEINKHFAYQLGIASENAAKAKNAELQSTAENSAQKNNTTDDSGVKYSIKKTKNMDYAQQIELVENEKLNGSNAIYIGEAPVSLVQAGFSDYPFAMNQSDYRKSRRTTTKNKNYSKHGVKRKFFEQLPQKINDAIMFIDNGEKVTIITDSLMLDSKGQPSYIIAGVMKNQKMDDDVVNQIKSVYPLDDFANIIRKNAENGKLVIINKNKANDLLAPIGIQPSQRSRIINLAKSSLSQVSDNVNGNRQNNAEIKKSIKLSPDAKKILDSNPELKQVFEYLQSQFKLARKTVPSEDQLMRYAEEFKKDIPTTLDVYKLKTEFRNIYSILSSMTDSRGLEYATSYTFKLTKKILENSEVLDKVNQDKKLLREQLTKALKGRKFKLTAEMLESINEHYGSWNELFKNDHGITRYLNKEASVTLEDEWNDLCAELPDLLDVNTHRDDQLFALIEAFNITDVEYGYHDEIVLSAKAQSLATEILSSVEKIFFNTIGENSLEDRHALEMNELREKTAKQIQKLKKKHQDDLINKSDYWREEIKKRAEKKRMTEMRNSIERQLIRFGGMLAKGTKNRHIPIQLIESVKELCEMFILRNSKQVKLSELLGKVEANYAALTESDDYTFQNAFSAEVAQMIEDLNKTVGNKNINSMTADELRQVDEVVRAIAQKVTRSNELFIAGRKETATEMASKVMDELTHRKTEYTFKREAWNKFFNATQQSVDRYSWKLLKPVYAFRLIGSDTLMELEKNLRNGEDVWAVDLSEAHEKFTELAAQYNHNKWKEEKATVHLFQGDATLSVQQLMFLYCAFQRKQFVPHLLKGGFVFENEYVFQEITDINESGQQIKNKKGEIVKWKRYVRNGTVRLHENDFNAIKQALTGEQRAYADAMRDYLAFDMGEKGNSVFRRLYDHNQFRDRHYFPIKVAREYIRVETQDAGEKSILGFGATKEVQENAKNPVILRDFDTVWAEHVQGMSTYHAFALRIDDFNKVYNYGTTSNSENVNSLKAKLKSAWGQEAVNYIETFLKDVNGRLRVDDGGNVLTKGIANFKKASVLMSASVVIQQPSAIIRAMSEVDLKYFATKPSFADNKEMKQYAPIAQIKAMGFFDTGIGPSSVNWLLEPTYEKDERLKAIFQDGAYRKKVYDKGVTLLPELMDEITWTQIWVAVKKETKALNKNLDGEELLKKAAERFTEVIELTQVYDSVFSKSEIMRSKDTGAKMATAFMAEPTVSLNMYVDAVVQGKRTSKKKMARIITCVVFSALLNSMLKSIVAAGRDDDEKRSQLEKYCSAVLINWVNDVLPWNMMPVIRDISSLLNGYDVERSDMSVIADLFKVLESVGDDEKSTGAKFIDVAGAVAALGGVPLKNVVRDIRGLMNTYNRIFVTKDAFDFEMAAIGLDLSKEGYGNLIIRLINGGKEKKDSDYMYDSIKNGKGVIYNRLAKELGSPEAVHNAMVRGLKDNDSRVIEAAQYRIKGDSVAFGITVKEIVNDGFPEKQVISAVNSMYNQLTEETEEESPEKAKSIYNSVDLYNAVNSGTNYAEIIDDMIEVEMKNGKTEEKAEETVRGRVRDYWKEEFLNASEAEQEVIRDKLDKTGLYEDVEKTTNEWIKDVLLERYDEATSYSQRKTIENQLWALGLYKTRDSLKSALKRRTSDDEDEK